MRTQTVENVVAQGRVVLHALESPRYRRLTVHAPTVAASARAGQFIHVLPRSLFSYDPLLRRAFSIMKVEGENIVILYRVEGRGTSLLAEKRVGDMLDFLGPLGQHFAPAPPKVFLVGGGVGVPPLLMLARQITGESGGGSEYRENERKRSEVRAIIGARTRDDVLCVNDFRECGVDAEVATDDGSAGKKGQVTDLLMKHLSSIGELESLENLENENGKGQSVEPRFRRDLMVYTCGPLPMLRAVAMLCARFQVQCQVSLEENMPCGIGVCNGCVVPVVQADDEYSIYRRICVEGPVMWAHEVKW